MELTLDTQAILQQIREGKALTGKDGALAPLIKQLTEAALQAEIESHLSLDLNRIHNASVGSTFTTKETQRYTQLLAQQTRIGTIIGVLERFNGESFLSITPAPPPTVASISNTRAVNNLDFNIHTKVAA